MCIRDRCTPKLNKTVELAKEINKLTDERSHQAVVRDVYKRQVHDVV